MTNHSADLARPAAALVSVKSAMPTTKMSRRPQTSPKRPAGTRIKPKVSAYPASTHCSASLLSRRARSIDGTATLTMLTSSSVMKVATRPTATATAPASTVSAASGVRSPRTQTTPIVAIPASPPASSGN